MTNIDALKNELSNLYRSIILHHCNRNWKLFMVRAYDARLTGLVTVQEIDLIDSIKKEVGNRGAKAARIEVEYSLRNCFLRDQDIDVAAYNAEYGFNGSDDNSYLSALIDRFMI